jgi:1-deoxy-D-xylulose-5-phosphate synthase
MALLERIKGSSDVKKFTDAELPVLADEIRREIIEVTSKNGGHIGPNLGVVELTLALHRVFETPKDRFVMDVAHQGYVHKLLTGRAGAKFKKIRQGGGLSGFLMRDEDPNDCYGAGHAGTALSAALGMAAARDHNGTNEHVVALLGDAALTCGITMEALNNVATSTKRLIVILNDNEWSIAKNVGAISTYLNKLITSPTYNRKHHDLESFLKGIPGGDSLLELGSRAKKEAKDFIVPSSLFEKFDLRYLGPIDGHDLPLLVRYLEFCKNSDRPVLLHVLTKKGRGYDVAIKNPEKFHGTSPFDIATGASTPSKPGTPPNWQDVFGKTLAQFAKADQTIIGITAAMPSGTSLSHLAKEVPKQFFDVGIAEEHAVLFAAGLATSGLHPVCAIYSTFLQRAYDPIIHDVALQNLPVAFCMDRAGLSPNDGPTHHGLFDIAYLRTVPRAVIMQPKDEDEMVDMLHTALVHQGPAFIRYPRGPAMGVKIKDQPVAIPLGQAEVLREGRDIVIWALGPMLQDAAALADKLAAEHGISVGIVNARFAKPLDTELLYQQARTTRMFVTMEDHVMMGGFGSGVLEALNQAGLATPVERIGWPDNFVGHGSSVAELRAQNGLSPAEIEEKVLRRWKAVAPAGTPLVAARR